MEAILIPISFFLVVFGIFYLYLSTRNKERLALIEKGVDASVFMKGIQQRTTTPFGKIFILNFALLLIGVGLGIFIGAILHYNLGIEEGVAYTGAIILMAGLGLFASFKMTQKLMKD